MRRERRQIVRWLPWLSWVGILAGVIVLVVIATRPEAREVTRTVTRQPPGPVVPDVAGRPARPAREALERAGFWVRVAREPSARTPRGRVLRTSPPEATRLGVGSQVTLLVSSGRPRVEVPALRGTSRSTAEERLLRAGFRVVVVRRESDDPPGAVIGQSPAPGRRVRANGVVRIAVAAPAPPVRVPDVDGLRFETAVERASAAGLAIEIDRLRVRREADVGRVVEQSPPGGRRVARGTKVTLVVGVTRADG